MSVGLHIREDDLSDPQTLGLLELHLRGMHAASPPGTVFALDVSGLKQPGVTVWTAWRDNRIAGIAALKMLGPDDAEIKSMRVHPDFVGTGVGRALLEHILAAAKARRLRGLSLETGSGRAFEPALGLYHAHGFQDGPPFSDYKPDGFSRFLHLVL